MARLTLSVASPDAPLTLARIGGVCRYNDRVRVVLSTRVGSIYRMESSRYIECGVVDLSTGSDSSYRLAEVDISPSRPSVGDHPTPLAIWLANSSDGKTATRPMCFSSKTKRNSA